MVPATTAAEPPSPDERARVLGLLRRHGHTATSFQVLERGFSYWFSGEDACVAYVDTGTAWVAGGDPVAPPERAAEVMHEFAEEASRQSRRAVFFGVETELEDTRQLDRVVVGEQPTWDARHWDEVVAGDRSLRYQLRRARAKGVTVRRIEAEEVRAKTSRVRQAVERLIERWLASRDMAPMGFMVDVQPFEWPEERMLLVAERGGRIVGFLAAVPVYAREGWFFEDLIRERTAPNGTAELLVDAAMRAAAEGECGHVTLGLAPLAGPVASWLRRIRALASPFYDFRGLHAFKAKLRPHAWQPIWLVYPRETPAAVAIYDSLRAFAQGNLFSFAARTVLRGPLPVVWTLTLLLVPWTLAMALASWQGWFPDPWIKAAWLVFDVALFAGLVMLARRYRSWLGVLMASVVTADAVITWAEAFVFNLPRLHDAQHIVTVAVACLAPTLAALVLWGAVRRRTAMTA